VRFSKITGYSTTFFFIIFGKTEIKIDKKKLNITSTKQKQQVHSPESCLRLVEYRYRQA